MLKVLSLKFIKSPCKAQTFSSYKHHNTVKVVIGIMPQASISFNSKAWGEKIVDKYFNEGRGL